MNNDPSYGLTPNSTRWQIELWFRDLKTTMGLEVLRCQTPPLLHKELETHFIATT